MKKTKIIFMLFLFLTGTASIAQKAKSVSGGYGNTLNLGLGVGGYSGYYGYVGHTLPVFNINYEFDVAKNFTLAPFLTYYSYQRSYYWGDKNHPSRFYTYRETVIPIGVKGTLYLDQLLQAGPKWDFYVAGSLGFAIVNSHWDTDYYGDRNYYRRGSSLFLDGHLGVEYHVNNKVGLFLDASTGVSTLGVAIHGN